MPKLKLPVADVSPLCLWKTFGVVIPSPQHGPARALLLYLGGIWVELSSLQFNPICFPIPADLLNSSTSFAAAGFDCENLIVFLLIFLFPVRNSPSSLHPFIHHD